MIADTCAGQHWVHTLSANWVGLGATSSATGWVQGLRPMPGHSQASMPPLQHIRLSPDWHAEQPQRAIGSYDPINRAHVRGRATQSGSARTWRLQGSSEGWYRRSAARKGRAVESSWRQRCRTWPDHVGAILWREPRLRFEGAPSGRFTATVCPPLTYLALRPMRCSVEHLMKGLGLREAHDLSSS